MSGAEYSVVVCDLGAPLCTEFHVESSVADMVDTTFSIPGYVDGSNYCFVPDTAGLFNLTIIAVDACGAADTNSSLITVIEGEPAVVECPEAITDTLCGAQMYCFPVAISPDTANVTVSPAGSWVAEFGQVCVPLEGSGLLDIAIIAQTECGVDSCHVLMDMTVIESPSIDCPGGDLTAFIEEAGLVCIDLPISNADSINVEGGTGYYEQGQLCFTADTTGRYHFTITASNSCAEDTCEVIVQMQVGTADYTTIVRPDPMRMIDAYRVDPMSAMVYLGNLTDEHTVADIDPTSLVINQSIAPTGTTIIPDFPGFVGEVMEIGLPVYDFIEYYMPLYDTSLMSYTVSGQFTDGVDFTETGLVRLIGLLVGDVNLDGQIDIADLIYLIDYQFQSGPAPIVLETADMDKNKFLDISDLIMLIDHMFEL